MVAVFLSPVVAAFHGLNCMVAGTFSSWHVSLVWCLQYFRDRTCHFSRFQHFGARAAHLLCDLWQSLFIIVLLCYLASSMAMQCLPQQRKTKGFLEFLCCFAILVIAVPFLLWPCVGSLSCLPFCFFPSYYCYYYYYSSSYSYSSYSYSYSYSYCYCYCYYDNYDDYDDYNDDHYSSSSPAPVFSSCPYPSHCPSLSSLLIALFCCLSSSACFCCPCCLSLSRCCCCCC